MVCEQPRPFYLPPFKRGIRVINSHGDGYTMAINWHRAYPSINAMGLVYNIYYSTIQGNAICEGPKFASTNLNGLIANVVDFLPGDTYFFVVRASEYDPAWYNINFLPTDPHQTDGYLKVYPETLLSENINDTQLNIPITDIDIFPSYGVIQIGYELIRYTSKDIPTSSLLASERGFLDTPAHIHNTDGYDGYEMLDPVLHFFKGLEEDNLYIIQEQSTFAAGRSGIYTVPDGYRINNRVGTLVTDSAANDADRVDFPAYDFVGWRRTDPQLFFTGQCVDSYLGGENFCADGYNGINRQIRNISFQDQASRLQEMLLDDMGTGAPVVLLRRMWSGITCRCYTPNQENPDPRCPLCFGTGYETGYQQYFYPRRSDGRILVRFGPATEDLKREDAGLESYIVHDCWTLTSPKFNDSDIIIKFNPDGTREWMYEVLDVTQNLLLNNATGVQKFRAQRIRKTDIIYQWRAIMDTSTMPTSMTTTVGMLRGPNNVPIPHTHTIVVNEGITMLSQVNQTTSVTQGHNHPIINGTVLEVEGHTHDIIL